MFKQLTANVKSKRVQIYVVRNISTHANNIALSVQYKARTHNKVSNYTIITTTVHKQRTYTQTSVYKRYKTRYNTTQYCAVHKVRKVFNKHAIYIALAKTV